MLTIHFLLEFKLCSYLHKLNKKLFTILRLEAVQLKIHYIKTHPPQSHRLSKKLPKNFICEYSTSTEKETILFLEIHFIKVM